MTITMAKEIHGPIDGDRAAAMRYTDAIDSFGVKQCCEH